MAKRKRDRHTSNVPAPTAVNVDFPVYVPNSDGNISIEVGRARLRYGTLVVEFKNSGPADAIQNMIQRGVLLGFNTVMVQSDVVNEMYQEVVESEENIADAVARGVNGGLLRFDENGKLESTNPDHTPEEIVQVLSHLDQIQIEKPVEESSGGLNIVVNEEPRHGGS